MEKDEIIRNAATFLLRVPLKGEEVPAFNTVME